MKKRTLKSLALNKKTVSNLTIEANIQGGAYTATCPSGGMGCMTKSNILFNCCPKPKPQEPQEPLPASDPNICTGPYGGCPINI